MNWFGRILRRKILYSNGKFSLKIVAVFRECVRLQYCRAGVTQDLSAEYVGRRWGALDVRVPSGLESGNLKSLVEDLEVGLRAMGREYLIKEIGEPVEVPQEEKERAVARLRQLGFEPEVLPDTSIRLKPSRTRQKSYSARHSVEIMTLLQAVHGRRSLVKELAHSAGYERAIHEN